METIKIKSGNFVASKGGLYVIDGDMDSDEILGLFDRVENMIGQEVIIKNIGHHPVNIMSSNDEFFFTTQRTSSLEVLPGEVIRVIAEEKYFLTV